MTEDSLIECEFDCFEITSDQITKYQKTRNLKVLDLIIKNNLELIRSIVNSIEIEGIDYDDLLQEALLEFVRVIKEYRKESKTPFSDYANFSIRYLLTNYISTNKSVINYPSNLIYGKFKILENIEKEYECTLDNELLSKISGISLNTIKLYRQYQNEVLDLNKRIYNAKQKEEHYLYEIIEDTKNLSPEEYVDQELLKEKINSVLTTLSPREEKIMKLRYGLNDGPNLSRAELEKKFKLAPGRIRFTEAKCLRKLRHPSRSRIIGIMSGQINYSE